MMSVLNREPNYTFTFRITKDNGVAATKMKVPLSPIVSMSLSIPIIS